MKDKGPTIDLFGDEPPKRPPRVSSFMVQFEAWAKQAKLDLRKHNGIGPGYIFTETTWAWLGWQSACLQADAVAKPE